MTDNPTLDEAVKVIAQTILRQAYEDAEWSDYPEIGEDDWDKVIDALDDMTVNVKTVDFEGAYEFLTERAA